VAPKDIGALYLLKLTYGIKPIERQLPSETELQTRAETDLITMFVDAFASREPAGDDLALARRLLTHESAERVVAGMLRDHLGARPDAQQAASEARRGKAPPPVVSPEPPPAARAVERRPEAPRRERASRPEQPRRGAPHKAYAAWEPPAEHDDDAPILGARDDARRPRAESSLPGFTEEPASSAAPTVRRAEPAAAGPVQLDEEGFVQIFVNVGRRDGASAGELQRILTERAGIERKDTGRIRVRDRNSFVSVKTDDLDRAVAAFVGQVLGGREVIAERARDRAD
jgi:ATP-dependent RNA helicase DeaD